MNCKKDALMMLVVLILIGITPHSFGGSMTGFVPELLKVDISATEIAPGGTFEMTWFWRNSGTEASLTNMVIGVHFRSDDKGFFNPDGGSWYTMYDADYKGPKTAGFPFQGDYFPPIPTTIWYPGKIITEGPFTVAVPGNSPEGVYEILVAPYDRGGRIQLGAANRNLHRLPIEACTGYRVGSIKVSNSPGEPAGTTWKFVEENIAPSTPEVEPVASIEKSRAVDAAPSWAGKIVMVGDKELGVGLDKSKGYALAAVYTNGTAFESGGKFPGIIVYDKLGQRMQLTPDSPKWKIKAKKIRKGLKVSYALDGFEMVVEYKINADGINARITPVKEEKYKALMLSGGGNIVNVPADKVNSSSAFILVPAGGGKLLKMPETTKQIMNMAWQSFGYPATFFGVGYNNQGLIVRCPQYGATWSWGACEVGGKFSLFGELAEAFRPSTQYFSMPRPEEYIDIQFVPVGDTNNDGVFNWVDIGVAYRRQFIKRNKNLDKEFRDSVYGKISLARPYTNLNNYSQLIEQIRTIDFAPQTWWLVGAHTSVDREFCDPPYSEVPDPSHNGVDGYDYFAFKKDAEKVGARIGLHEIFQDISSNDPMFDVTPLKQDLFGGPKATWGAMDNGTTYWTVYPKALNVMLKDGSLFRSLDEHFKNWDIRSGDTWHWDCLSAFCGQQDYNPEHPATNGTDYRDSIELAKYIKSKGINFTSEGLQEGMSEYVDLGWRSEIFFNPAEFETTDSVPLTPVLFQGMSYYSGGASLIFGGKAASEGANIEKDKRIQSYFGYDVFWRLIADRTVRNMIKTDTGYRAEYDQGGVLIDDFKKKTFVLEIDGKKYTPQNPPATAWGVTAKLVNGKYELTYPNEKKN